MTRRKENMNAGFYEVDITPRVGVGLCGFGPFLNRRSIGVRDKLKARAAAFQVGNEKAVIVSCDLIGITAEMATQIKEKVSSQTTLTPENLMVHCTHTHSGPNTGDYQGWGDSDPLYLEILPGRIVKACLIALEQLELVDMYHAEAKCEGIGLNREYDIDAPPLQEVLDDNWRPAKPELTDTICQVFKFISVNSGKMTGFMTYFGCHPVVCCEASRYIHGDYCGVALNNLEKENNGAVGLFLQGAQGDVNSCVVHKPEKEALEALDVIAERFAKAARNGLKDAEKMDVDLLKSKSIMQKLSTKDISIDKLRGMLAEREAIIYADGATDEERATRMAMVGILSIRRMIKQIENGDDLTPVAEIQGIKLGPIAFLSGPFEIMQAIKNDVQAKAKAELPLVMGITNGTFGYAPDKTVAARGGYAADTVPIITGMLPYANIHEELVSAFLKLDGMLN
jgi:neutral/alkaline ceramidase-like enzyme